MLFLSRYDIINEVDFTEAKMQNQTRVKYACYATNVSMSVVANISPILFLTFRSLYGISYSLLGLLVLINFFTQLTIDLIFSFFSHKFNIPKAVKFTPVLTVVGLVLYAISAWILPQNVYLGLVVGTVIFSASGGFSEVLISPVIAALPADNPEREMSKLHSVYAWGVVFVIVIGTLFLLLFGAKSWQWLALAFTIVPIVACGLFFGAKIPEMQTPERASGAVKQMKDKRLWLSVFAIFLGGASECTMSQWSSGYLEGALGIPKIFGDIFGVAFFALALGLGRSLYAKKGENIGKVLFLGGIGATACYLIAALTPFPVVGLIACGLTGFCTSMLWPGNLIVASNRIANGGVFLYAMMAAGGDLGASVAPQLVGAVTDLTMQIPALIEFASVLAISPEQLGMKLGMFVGALFPLLAVDVYYIFYKEEKKSKKE